MQMQVNGLPFVSKSWKVRVNNNFRSHSRGQKTVTGKLPSKDAEIVAH